MIKRKFFFDTVNKLLFKGKLSPSAWVGMELMLTYWEANPRPVGGPQDIRWLAYILATTMHETQRTFQPIEEFGKGHGKKYGKPDPQNGRIYYGRGYCQITYRVNYEKFGKLLGIDLVNHPELALVEEYALKIIFIGMEKGQFTGRKLADYFNAKSENWYKARRIINGDDCASAIAEYGKVFYQALQG